MDRDHDRERDHFEFFDALNGHDAPSLSNPRPRLDTTNNFGSSTSTNSASTTRGLFGSGTTLMPSPIPDGGQSAVVTSQLTQSPLFPPLSTLAGPSNVETMFPEDVRSLPRRHIPKIEKEVDDPTNPPAAHRGHARPESATLATLSKLFAVQTSPEVSRSSSYLQPGLNPYCYSRNHLLTDTAALPEHLYRRGLLQGRHSDIAVNAFGHRYKLHRLVLDRAPFFATALNGPWLEANSKEITVHPEDIDPSITQASFELALKRLYGCGSFPEEDGDAVGLFATGCWLEMQDLIDSAIESILRQMTPQTLSGLVKLVTSNYYGKSGDKILASAKAMLCRDGWRMPLKNWDGVPGDVIREIVGGDGFFIEGEWDRWVLAKRILDRRLRLRAIEAGLVMPGRPRKVRKAPNAANLMAIRFDGVYRKSTDTGRGVPDSLQPWISLYTHPDVESLLVLLDEGIHYIHLDFEQLQYIRSSRDSLGLPVMGEKVITNALWQQMELRQRVLNAREVDLELGVSVKSAESLNPANTNRDTTMSIITPSAPPKGKQKASDPVQEEDEEEMASGSWDGNGKPRKFWIPSSDCNIVMGGNADPVIATSNNTTIQRHASRLSSTMQPEDIQWAADFTAVTSQPRPTSSDGIAMEVPAEVRYTHLPPYRFSCEFPSTRTLKEKKRVYSRTVFYAGSLWNIYVQKVASSRSKQLGVYLHRAKERETEEVIASTAGLAQGSVDERIGALEREMLISRERKEWRQRRATAGSDGADMDGEDSGSGEDPNTGITGASQTGSGRAHAMRNLLSRSQSHKAGQTDVGERTTRGSQATDGLPNSSTSTGNEDDEDDELAEDARLAAATRQLHVPTLPPYVDARPTIRTYFKIYSPSRGGRMLSVYESAPDRFNFSQSWGWKSSTLMLDEGMLGEEEEEAAAAKEDELGARPTMKRKGDNKLRFSVVIGCV